MKMVTIEELKKGDKFKFNNITYTVRQKFSDWKKDGEPYMLTENRQLFYNGELEVEKKINNENVKYEKTN